MSLLLHEENLESIPLTGKRLKRKLETRVRTLLAQTEGLADPDISVVIRTRNNMAYIESLFADIHAQVFEGKVEIILVDTESTDGTAEFAKAHGAKVITIKQVDFSYPRALNMGFKAAQHPYVVSIVGHCNLVSPYMFKSVTAWCHDAAFGGMFGAALNNWNASRTERLFWMMGGGNWLHAPKLMAAIKDYAMGTLAANACVVKRSAWEKLGGYDEAYAGGGEDGALGKAMLARGWFIVREPLCSVYHSHHVGPINMLRQIVHWHTIAKPTPFVAQKIHRRRPDLRT